MRWLRDFLLPRRPRIRPMTYTDIPDARELLHAAFHAAHDRLIGVGATDRILREFDTEEAFARYFDLDYVSLLVADRRDEIVGLALGGVAEERNFIAMLYVHPEYQRQGIGQRLLLELLHRHPPGRVEVECVAGNSAAQAFFAAHGFVPVARRMDDGVEVVVMQLAREAA